MSRRRTFVRALCGGLVAGLAGCSRSGSGGEAGETTTDAGATTVSPTEGFTLTSPAFADGEPIPTTYTFDGDDVSPPLRIAGVPDDATTLALLVDDPDAPGGPFYHWLLWNVPADTTELPAGVNQVRRVESLGDARQGTNGFGELGYRGPRPPEGDDAHTYRFTLYAVAGSLNVQAGARYTQVTEALSGETRSTARLTGTYDR